MVEATADLAEEIRRVAAKVETARAKINLALHVLSRRTDGYHLIDSLTVFADAGDTVEAHPIDEPLARLTVDGPFANDLETTTRPQDNLVLRAADELSREFGGHQYRGVRLHLTKRLPVAAGIGGGSADAAAALRLLSRYWGIEASAETLARVGLRLGADVPMCLVSRPLRAEGIGERIAPQPNMPALPLVLAHPGATLSTAAVFRRLPAGERTAMLPLPGRFANLIEFVQWLRLTRNDLAEPAAEEARAVTVATRVVAGDPECLFARMSGSGATVFGIFNSPAAAERAAARISAARPGWWVIATRAPGS
ncbi:MAG TPA: 4-(cytidine 5'-diphospho)-2-C-methyl-D-erythritol kinase [Bauldia sp.]|nr:4-(cytidine 5'-diphospho)-2-C-methyl-D-erythritol kinase [Bauldia sp.]